MKSSHRYLLLTVACLAISCVAAFLWVAHNFPRDPYAGAAVAKVVPIVLPIATLVCFSVIWFPALLLYTGVRWLRSPATFREEWRRSMGYFFIAFILLAIVAFPWARKALVPPTPNIDPKEKAHWIALARGPTVELAGFRRMIDAYSAQSQRGLSNLDWRYEVLRLATQNEGATTEYLSYLAEHLEDGAHLMKEIAANPHSPEDTLRRCARSRSLEEDLAGNPAIPRDILLRLLDSGDTRVMTRLAENPATPREIIVRLANSPTPQVREAAQKHLDEHPASSGN